MEIPENIKSLYRHWNFHTYTQSQDNDDTLDPAVVDQILPFIIERMKIWEKKTNDDSPPFTKDPILQQFRFCNIYRELDKQTIEFHTLLHPIREQFELWLLNILFCRLICNPGTVNQIGLLSFDQSNNKKIFNKLKNLPSPKYGTAYVFPISAIQRSKYPTREEFFCFYLPKVIGIIAQEILTFRRIGVSEALEKVLPKFGFNLKFHWTETLIDVAYQFPEYIDLFEKFPVGPGALPTMKLLNGGKAPEEVCLELISFILPEFSYLQFNGQQIYLSAENWEGICCEFRKYSNLKDDKGRRRLYKTS